jgi:hypothetical protein
MSFPEMKMLFLAMKRTFPGVKMPYLYIMDSFRKRQEVFPANYRIIAWD